ncbi:hypothetical protein [Sphingobium sp. YR768]|uniref:hypothetical protein n=1 Tax=Sphingobium sp. YR768 TaxID=1884365 RepID=UPI0008CD4C39|nr:hypothetical protein [Sphingobium sp. YR768]SEQ60709.1 hypothetical protein SAMN05518866_101498 [Sphingobium sp. YR768]
MDDSDSPGLGVGFAIDPEGSFDVLRQLQAAMDSTEGKIIAEAARIEAATGKMINLGGATAQVTSFSNATTRDMAIVARETARAEKAGESLSRQLERQAASFGKTREEMRAMKVEAAALAAEQQGLTELATRLRAQELALYEKEFAAARKASQAAEAAAEDKAVAAAQAIATAEREATATREAAWAYDMFQAKVREGAKALRELEAAERAASLEAEAKAAREAGFAYQMFEARARAGAKALREVEAAQAAADRERASAINAADSYAAKLEAETAAIGKNAAELRAMEVAKRAADADGAGLGDQAERIRAAGAAYAQATAQAQALEAEQRRLADASRESAEAARQAAAAQAAQDASVLSLRSSVDPLFGAQQRLSRELEEAVRLYRAGAIGQEEYERSSTILGQRLDEVARAQARQNDGMDDVSRQSKLSANDLTNIAFQLQDIIVSLQGGQKPLTVLMQQGSQLGGIMMQTGASVGDMVKAILGLAIVTTPTAAAVAALTEAEAAQAAAQIAAATTGSAAAITTAELAVANEAATAAAARNAVAQDTLALAEAAVASGAVADATALAALAAAQTAAAATAAELAAAQGVVVGAEAAAAGASQLATAAAAELATAQAAAAAASTAAAASATAALAPWLIGLAAVAAPLALVAGGIKLLQNTANEGADMKKYAESLGLTAKEIRNLDDVTVTFGDTTKAVFQVAGSAIWGVIGPAVTKVWDVMKEWTAWVGSGVKTAANFIIGYYVASFNAVRKTWSAFPAVMGDLFYSAVNMSIGAINWMVQSSVDALNGFISTANGVLEKVGLKLPTLSAPQIDKVENQYAGVAKSLGKSLQDEMIKATSVDYLGNMASAASNAIVKQAQDNARARIKAQATEKGYLDPEKPKTDKHAESLAREAEATEAQIRNLYALADAYKVSGAAALIAEARVKAESAAIKKRGDIEAMVERQIRLAIAQRVADAAKNTLAAREQASAQEQVNAMVSAGLIPAERAATMVRDQIADLPLLAALQVAQQRGYAKEVEAAQQALDDQRGARERLTAAERKGQFNSDMAAGADQLATLEKELSLIGATDAARVHELATLKAQQEAKAKLYDPADAAAYVARQVEIADATERNRQAQDSYNDSLTFAADQWDIFANNISTAARGMADAFGDVGQAIGDMASIYADYHATAERLESERAARVRAAGDDQAAIERANARYFAQTATSQVGLYGDMSSAAKGFFKEGSDGYKALETAEKAFRAVEFALSVRAMAQDAIETASSIAKSGARTATKAVEAVVTAISSLPFPLNLAAGAATIAALASIGVAIAGSFGGNKNTLEKANDGTGTVLGDVTAKSDSIKRSIDALKEVDTVMLTYSRQMAASLSSIESQIGGFASLVLRTDNVNASDGVAEGFKSNAIGSVLSNIPVIGGLLGSLFGTKTTVIGSGLYGGAQTLEDILSGGYDASYYSDIKKKKKFFGLTTSTKYSTQYSDADAELENQFTLILRQFNDAILAAAGPLGASTDEISQKLNGFVVSIGKIDLQGLTGDEIEEKLNAVFGAAADDMAKAAFPTIAQFQQVGEGLFETLVRVASTVESVTASLGLLGSGAVGMSIDLKMSLADYFDSVSDFTSAVDSYFEAYYTKEEQATAQAAQFATVFDSLGLAMPDTLAGFRALVEAQDLTTAAGQSTYATLLQLAPAFADLQSALNGAKSAADILSERSDLERQLLELQGDTDAIRALDLAKLDASNRALQEQIWAVQDAQEAADAAAQLKDAWTSVGDSILDEVNRIRGITDGSATGSFATLLGQFNAATTAAKAGDQDAASSLPGLSQALLTAAEMNATSRQELDRVKAQTAAALQSVYDVITAANGSSSTDASGATSTSAVLAAASTASTASTASSAANDDVAAAVESLRQEVAQMRSDMNSGQAQIAANTGSMKKTLDNVTSASGGEAVSVAGVAA